MSKFFITTAIDYPSGKPHMGHAYEKICTDVIARYKRLKGRDVHFSTGTDEHGEKVEDAAKALELEPKEFCDQLVERFKDAWKKLNIS